MIGQIVEEVYVLVEKWVLRVFRFYVNMEIQLRKWCLGRPYGSQRGDRGVQPCRALTEKGRQRGEEMMLPPSDGLEGDC